MKNFQCKRVASNPVNEGSDDLPPLGAKASWLKIVD
jgi:hypothetical protein